MAIDQYRLSKEPEYFAHGDEIRHFKAAHAARMPMAIKGPTGCGKTRFVEHMAWKLDTPLITVSCHEDMTAADLVGRYLLNAEGTYWQDGPLTLAVRYGAICYLDEIVETRQDTTVVIHSLTDDRRVLTLEKKNELVQAHTDFQLVISYNPGYQSILKDLKESTKQRFCALDFSYPDAEIEAKIVTSETGLSRAETLQLVTIAEKSRNLRGAGLTEGISTRMLVHAARLMTKGLSLEEACALALVLPITDDPDMRTTLTAVIDACV